MLITHRGLSGPSILQVSSYWQPGDDLVLDLLPGRDAQDFLVSQRNAHPDALLHNVLADVLPRRFAQRLCEAWLEDRPMKQFDAKPLREMAALLSRFPVVASGTEGYRTAEVTLGGVDTRELSSTTMESRRVPGLYFIGEVVDVTGWLGGYNFQWAWACADACGKAVCEG
jgi:predicted Rossmann fold flavoprotein